MMQRNDVTHCPHSESLRPHAPGDGVQRRRRHPALIGAKVMFDAKTEVKSEVVAELQLLPQLFVTLVWSHAWLAPDMGEMSKLHQISFIVMVRAGFIAK